MIKKHQNKINLIFFKREKHFKKAYENIKNLTLKHTITI
jgi:hypothetical protein